MNGTINKLNNEWVVQYPKYPTSDKIYDTLTLPLHPDDAVYCLTSDLGKQVEFDIIDEFTHPELFKNVGWGDGTNCAKLK